MNTFHIVPSTLLAVEAAAEVRQYPLETLLAIRGEQFYYGDDDDPVDVLYTVSPCPDQDNPWKYAWTYVRAGEWLAEFNSYHGISQ